MIPSYEYRARQPVTRGVSAVGRIKRIGLLLALLAAALGLGGCGYDVSVEELFTLPRMAEGYTDLAQQLDGLLNQGYEYASPTGGRNIQSVQMVDLDGDGRQEALAFMRRSSDEKPLKIFVFRMENENYQLYCTIESSGTAVDSVYYQDLNGDGRRELVVGWRISTDVQTVAVYAVEREPVALMSSGYTRFMMQDLNGDGLPSLLVLRTSEEGLPVAEFYGWQDGQMGIAYRCTLSSTMAALSRGSLVSGRMDAATPAMFITGVDEQGMAVTALAGPVSNLLLAVLFLGIGKVIYLYAPYSAGMNVFFEWCLFTVAPMSVGMGLFNLIPIPPLDGSKVLAMFLPNSAYGQLMRYERYGILVLLALSWLGLGGNFLGDAIYGVYEALFHIFFA